MSTLLSVALARLVVAHDDDHQRVCQAASGAAAPAPVSRELAALAAELRSLRAAEPDAAAMALLGEAASRHPEAVEEHLAWLATGGRAPLVIALPGSGTAPELRRFSLAS